MTSNTLALCGAMIYGETEIIRDAAVIIKDNVIDAVVPKNTIKNTGSIEILNFPGNFHLVPGFIDMHVHGARGKDVMDGSVDALATISQALAEEGTTSFLATTMTASVEHIDNVLSQVKQYTEQQHDIPGATMLGIHLEGPFLSPHKVGAQCGEFILEPDIKLIERWQKQANQLIKMVTIAPELKNSLAMIHYLKQQNIIAAMGHTDASFATTMEAIHAGCSHATHLFNAMRSIHQREPGVAGAVLLAEKVMAELIVDGMHLHPAMIRMALKLKGAEKLILVTDAMRGKCMCDGVYDLGGQQVTVKKGAATLANGTLAGSTLKMSDAIANMLQFTDCDLFTVIKMASENPARALNVFDKKGSIKVGKDADLVVLDDQLKVVMTICQGLRSFSHNVRNVFSTP